MIPECLQNKLSKAALARLVGQRKERSKGEFSEEDWVGQQADEIWQEELEEFDVFAVEERKNYRI